MDRIALDGTCARGSYLYFGEFGRLDCVIGVDDDNGDVAGCDTVDDWP